MAAPERCSGHWEVNCSMSDNDLYAVLGVLPDAEEVVVSAAYRALANRYHPDRWRGDPDEAHRRMAAINEAYAVLGDRVRRAAYDRDRSQRDQADYSANDAPEQEEAVA